MIIKNNEQINLLVVVDPCNVINIGTIMAASSTNPIIIPANTLAIQGHFEGIISAAGFRYLSRLLKISR